LTTARSIEDSSDRAAALGELAPYLPAEQRATVLAEALTTARSIGSSDDHARILGELAPQLSGNLLQQGFEELLDVLPRCERGLSLLAVSSFFPFLKKFHGLEDVRCAIIDTARWFP
jgi:hypothetical protein